MRNPKYPLELVQRIITVSLETMKIVRNLPEPAAPYRAAGYGVVSTGSFVTFQTSSPKLLSQRCSLPESTTVAVKT